MAAYTGLLKVVLLQQDGKADVCQMHLIMHNIVGTYCSCLTSL